MPVQIGAKRESNFDDPLGLLSDCHRRIERFLAVLTRLTAQQHGMILSEQDRQSLQTALQYFREAAPRHTADEEESLFPRLREDGRSEAQWFAERLASLDADHVRAKRLHDDVDGLGRIWLVRELSPEETRHLSDILAELGELYRRHIAMEDLELFPAAADALTSNEIAAVGAEMATRRGLRFDSSVKTGS